MGDLEKHRYGSSEGIEEWQAASDKRLAESEEVLVRLFGPGSFPEPPVKAMNASMKSTRMQRNETHHFFMNGVISNSSQAGESWGVVPKASPLDNGLRLTTDFICKTIDFGSTILRGRQQATGEFISRHISRLVEQIPSRSKDL